MQTGSWNGPCDDETITYLDCGSSYMNIHLIKLHRINNISMCVHPHMHKCMLT